MVFHFALDREPLDGDLAAGVLWVTLLFAAVLGINRLFVAEREEGGFDGFLLAPVDRTALFVAKAAVLFGFLVALELVAVPAFALLLLGPVAVPGAAGAARDPRCSPTSGIAVDRHARRRAGGPDPRARPDRAAARAAAARAARDRRRAARPSPLFAAGGRRGAPARWLGVLGLYDLVFGLLAYAVFDFLLED